jgi:hypothetical protein
MWHLALAILRCHSFCFMVANGSSPPLHWYMVSKWLASLSSSSRTLVSPGGTSSHSGPHGCKLDLLLLAACHDPTYDPTLTVKAVPLLRLPSALGLPTRNNTCVLRLAMMTATLTKNLVVRPLTTHLPMSMCRRRSQSSYSASRSV